MYQTYAMHVDSNGDDIEYITDHWAHFFSGYVSFYLFSLFVFHVISVNIVNVIFCK